MFKGILSFVPLIAGQASGLYVLYKKKDKVPWTEGGSVLWTAGIAATLTLIYNIFDLSIDWTNILILIAVSVAPIVGILRRVAPLIVYYAIINIFAKVGMEKQYLQLHVIFKACHSKPWKNDVICFGWVLMVTLVCLMIAWKVAQWGMKRRCIND